MPIEPSARQPGIVHDFVNRDLGKSPSVEEPPRAFEDFLVRIVLMLW
jgi:hypothetical protein